MILLTVLLFSNTVFASGPGKLVLVMDDIGNQYQSGLQAIELPWVTTVAIMPGRPYTRALAERAHQLGKEIIIHAPMSNLVDFPLGPMGLTRTSGRLPMLENIRLSIDDVPYAVGLSNHMGSRLTQDAEAMSWLMAELKSFGFYFFDSRTTADTVAWQEADHAQIPWSMRHYFLDHYTQTEFLASQWQKALKRVAEGENITVIAHPYPETLAFLSQLSLESEQASLMAPLSSVLHHPQILVRQSRNQPAEDV